MGDMSEMYDEDVDFSNDEFMSEAVNGDKMQITVEKTSNKFGPSFMAGGVWYNPDKFTKPDFSAAVPGAVLEIEANGKYVKSLTVVTAGAPVAAQAPANNNNNAGGGFKGKDSPEVRLEIARGTAVKAVLSSSLLAAQFQNMDIAQAASEAKGIIKEMTHYILTGKFTETE